MEWREFLGRREEAEGPLGIGKGDLANSADLLLSIPRGSESFTGGHQFNLTEAQGGLPQGHKRKRQ